MVGIDGLVLEVEPEEGAARDYRERARGSHDSAAPQAPETVPDDEVGTAQDAGQDAGQDDPAQGPDRN